jgi:hypothetical protein
MSASKPENDCGLIISSQELIRIREACRQRRAELEAAGTLPALTIAPGSPQNGFEAPDPDGLVSGPDATSALRLVADKLGIPIAQDETIPTLRAGELRKLLRDRFGQADSERTMVALWRLSPVTDGAPRPNEDQSHCSPGVSECPRSMPVWRREFYSEASGDQRLLEGIGAWCG